MQLILFIFLFLNQAFADREELCRTPRQAMQTFLDNLQKETYAPKVAATCFADSESHNKQQIAIHLKQILDAKGYLINYAIFPNDPNYTDPDKSSAHIPVHVDLPSILLEKKDGLWIFPENTFPYINTTYQQTFSSFVSLLLNTLPPWFQSPIIFNIQPWQPIYFILLLLFSWALGHIVDKIIINRLVIILKSFKLTKSIESLKQIRKPIMWATFGIVLLNGAPNMKLYVGLSRIIMWSCKFIITFSILLLISRLLNSFAEILADKASKTESKLDDQLIPLLRRMVQIVLWTVGGIFLLQNYGIDVTSLITVGSLATIGIGLASKDAVENLFGSIVAFVDQPFQIGDWVIIDGSIEGVVEEVGFRSTRIRAFTNSIITVPNAKITRCTVNNFGKRDMRRFKCTLGLRYDTPVEKIETYIKDLRTLLEGRESIKSDSVYVYLNNMSSSSLDIMIYTFFIVKDWRVELSEKEYLYLQFIKMAESMGIGFAFPTQTIELENKSPAL